MKKNLSLQSPVLTASVARIALYYAVFGILWVLFSDALLSLVMMELGAYHDPQRTKGLIFVALSVILVYFLTFRAQYKSRLILTALEKEHKFLSGILEGIRAGTWEWHVPTGHTVFNARWAEIIGYTLEELAPISVRTREKYTHPDDLRVSNEQLRRHFNGELEYYECECRMRHKDGHWVWIQDRGRVMERSSDDKPVLMLGTHIDISERKAYEFEMRRIARLYVTLSETNQALLRISEQEVMFRKICAIAVEHGGFSLAWVGLPDKQKHSITVAASSGETGYLQGIGISYDPAQAGYHGPTALAYLSGERQVINDFAHHERTAPWRERAAKFNIQASAAFPLYIDGEVYGVLNIYADEPGYFQQKEIELLEEMAADISFGVENFNRIFELARSEARFHAIAQGISDAIVMADPQRTIEWVNPAFERIFGYPLEEIKGNTTDIFYENLKDYRQQPLLGDKPFSKSGSGRFEMRYRCKEGATFIGETMGTPLQSEAGELLGYLALIRNVTQEREIQEQLRIAAAAFEVENGIMIANRNLRIERVNQAFTRITGYEADEVIGADPGILKSGQHSKAFYRQMWRKITEEGFWEGEIWNRKKDGEIYPEWLTISVVRDESGDLTHYIASFSDITERKAAEQRIHELAFFDSLTHLANRRLFIDRVEHARLTSERSNQYGALLMLDMDHFKVLNDTQGHHYGDQLLIEVGRRLKGQVREADTVARIGGDEFVILLESLGDDNDVAINFSSEITDKIQHALIQPYKLDNIDDYRITPSISVVLFHGQKTSVEELLKQADVALYEAKAAGRNTVRFFNPDMQDKVNDRARLEGALSKALEQDEFLLYYQPQMNRDGYLVGAEALLRWMPKESGSLVSPAEFIPLAEDTGLIVPIGYWVLDTACRQLYQWQQQRPGAAFNLAVNISARQFHQHGFIEHLRKIIELSGVNPTGLKLELTESVVLDDIGYVIARLQELRELGIGTSMDDFGTGYSSLSYLKRLPIEQLKIDTSFVRDIAHSSHDSAIVRAIIAMGHSLGLQIVAEGVETEEQKAYLNNYECDLYQGYLFGRPMPVEEFEQQQF